MGQEKHVPLLSIIVPTLNEEKIIGETLSRIKTGLHVPHEIIVSDGGSTDSTLEMTAGLADQIVRHEKPSRQTIAEGRNAGARIARGSFFVFLDADCAILEPDAFFQKTLKTFAEDKRVVALSVRLRVLPKYETQGDRFMLGLICLGVRFKNNVLHRGEAMGGEFQMIRADAFRAVKGYREDLVTREDSDMFFRLSRTGKTIFDANISVFHTGRRAHTLGWPRLVLDFFVNTIYLALFHKTHTKDWKVIR